MPSKHYDGRARKAVKTVVEGVTLDSEWEANVYRHLLKLFDQEYIICHSPINVLPASKHFPVLNWRCDFQLLLPWRKTPLYIEAKGVCDDKFKVLMQTLSYTKPHVIDNLIVVHSECNHRIGTTIRTVDIHTMYQFLQRLKG